jgi:hypothetical protein
VGIADRKDALRREIERRERELEKLDSLPDFDAVEDGTVLGLAVTLGRSQPYSFVAYRTRGSWYLTGKNAPNGVSSEDLSEWLTTGGRRLMSATVLASFGVQVVDLGEVLGEMLGSLTDPTTRRRGSEWRDRVCADDDCGCSGKAHP